MLFYVPFFDIENVKYVRLIIYCFFYPFKNNHGNTFSNKVHGKLRCNSNTCLQNEFKINLTIHQIFPLLIIYYSLNKLLQSQHNRQFIDVTQSLSNFPRMNDFLSHGPILADVSVVFVQCIQTVDKYGQFAIALVSMKF